MNKEKIKPLIEQNIKVPEFERYDELEVLLRKNGYGSECVEFFKEYWPQACLMAFTGAIFAGLGREKAYLLWDTGPRIGIKTAQAAITRLNKGRPPEKQISKQAVGGLISKNKKVLAILGLLLPVLGYATYDTYDKALSGKTKDNIGDAIGDLFKSIIQIPLAAHTAAYTALKNSNIGKGIGLQGNDCAPLLHHLMFAAGSVALISTTDSARPFKLTTDVLWQLFKGSISKAKNTLDTHIEKQVAKHLSDKGVVLKPELEEFFANLPSKTRAYSEETKEEAVATYRTLDPDGEYLDEAEDIIELIWRDGIYQQKQINKALTDQSAKKLKQSEDIIRTAVKELEQLGFNFGGKAIELPAPKLDEVPDIIRQSDEAFKSGNIKQAIESLDQVVKFYRKEGLLDDAVQQKQALAIIEETRSEFPDASDFDVLRVLTRRLSEVFSEINFSQAEGAVSQIGKGQMDISDEAIESIIEKEVDDVLFYSTSNLPAVVGDQVPDMREETVAATMGFFQTMKGKVSKKAAAKIAIGVAAAALTAGSNFSLKKNKPTGSPYYYEDDSIYSILNGPTGQNEYKDLRDNLLGNKEAMKQFYSLAFDTKDPYIEEYLQKLSKEDVKTQDIDEKVDEVLRGYGKVLLEVLVKSQGMFTNQYMLQTFGTSDDITINKRYVQQQMSFEIFLFNDVIASKLKSYYKKVAPSAGVTKRLQNLKEIFSLNRAKWTAAREKIQNLDKYYANDYRMSRGNNKSINEVKQMNKQDIRQFVAEVLNENSGQGYGKYPYHSNEYTEEEPDQDYSVEWKSLVDEVCGTKRKNVDGDPNTVEDLAVEVAKILVKDSDLFRDVLEMAGSNKSIGVEIMSQLKTSKEKKNLNKKMNV